MSAGEQCIDNKKDRLFESEQEVLDLWQNNGQKVVIFQGVVYDVSEYMDQHPGGSELIENELGKNIDEPFEEAEHTKSARNIFKDLPIIGKMKESDTSSTNSSNEAKNDNKKAKQGLTGLYGNELNSKIQFDYNKSLFWQLVKTDWSYEDYMQYINEPKHLVNPVRNLWLFDFYPLELVTMTPAWLIPVAYIPLCYYCWTQVPESNSVLLNIALFIGGFANWSFLEYVLHRFFFHMEDKNYFIQNRYFYVCHFLVHGIHHAFPNDHYRIVFPPILGYMVWYAILEKTYKHLFPPYIHYMFSIGATCGYVAYDSIHYQLHKLDPKNAWSYAIQMKKDHMQHHYKNGTVGFGVTQHFWDNVFDTMVTAENTSMKEVKTD